jgi:hypothetical protein
MDRDLDFVLCATLKLAPVERRQSRCVTVEENLIMVGCGPRILITGHPSPCAFIRLDVVKSGATWTNVYSFHNSLVFK